jgi:hypothetical protein
MATRLNITLPQGEDRTIVIHEFKLDSAGVTSPVDLTISLTRIWFTVKERLEDDDSEAVIAKTSGVAGGPGGITPNLPVTPEKNAATIEVDADDWTVDRPGVMHYDIQVESQGEQFRTHYGLVKAPRGATRA